MNNDTQAKTMREEISSRQRAAIYNTSLTKQGIDGQLKNRDEFKVLHYSKAINKFTQRLDNINRFEPLTYKTITNTTRPPQHFLN